MKRSSVFRQFLFWVAALTIALLVGAAIPIGTDNLRAETVAFFAISIIVFALAAIFFVSLFVAGRNEHRCACGKRVDDGDICFECWMRAADPWEGVQ